ncbi:phage shock protein PspC (stress-responsive transcriptional regulator) [Leifsonia sp. AK011]|uniref:PspC domain-containing protein n=1 Tax=Leifsonia sp. AK011 TaxID=2723075 RepID=UPI0015C82CFD|nr:PspC domain-containing protein [Leifsonia sp. AK011]NYF08903.1 phage shock protein PspC (stress-responsive transcriptional regulator) [Leifsonia sp. AK011]
MPKNPAPETPPTEEPAAAEAPTPPPPLRGSYRFFSWLRSLDLRREPGWIGGVCAGIASRLGIDPLIVRGIAVVIAVLGGPAILLYAAAWLLLPDASDKIHLEEIFRGRLEPATAGIAAFFVLAMLPVTQGFWYAGAGFWGIPDWGTGFGRALWTIVLIGALVWFLIWLSRRTNPPVPPAATGTSATDAAQETSASAAGTSATGRSANAAASATFVASETSVTPPADATEPEVADWRAQQAKVRAEQEAFRNQQASDRHSAHRAAAEEARAVRAAQREKDRVAYARTRSNPLYSLVVIGVALITGGLAVVLTSDGVPTTASVTIGLAASLAVLAVGIVINGVRGKRSGGASGVAWIVLVALLLTGSVRWGTDTIVEWGPRSTLVPTSSQDYAFGAGRVTLDLREMEPEILDGSKLEGSFGGESVSLTLGAGTATVIVPDDVTVQFSGSVGAGSIDAGPNEDSTRIGPVERASAEFGPRDPTQLIVVSVQLGAGQIRVIEAGE